MLEGAPTKWPILEWTSEEGPPTDIEPKFCKSYGYPPEDEAKYLRQQCTSLEEPDTQPNSSDEWVHSHTEWFDPEEHEDLACYTEYND